MFTILCWLFWAVLIICANVDVIDLTARFIFPMPQEEYVLTKEL